MKYTLMRSSCRSLSPAYVPVASTPCSSQTTCCFLGGGERMEAQHTHTHTHTHTHMWLTKTGPAGLPPLRGGSSRKQHSRSDSSRAGAQGEARPQHRPPALSTPHLPELGTDLVAALTGCEGLAREIRERGRGQGKGKHTRRKEAAKTGRRGREELARPPQRASGLERPGVDLPWM